MMSGGKERRSDLFYDAVESFAKLRRTWQADWTAMAKS